MQTKTTVFGSVNILASASNWGRDHTKFGGAGLGRFCPGNKAVSAFFVRAMLKWTGLAALIRGLLPKEDPSPLVGLVNESCQRDASGNKF